MSSLQHLLRHGVDYAGLFPPAALDMAKSVRNYAAYREDAQAWALGRFVLPAARLEEFEAAAAPLLPPSPSPFAWRLATLVGPDVAGDLHVIGEFNCRHAADGAPAVSVDVIEGKADSVAAVGRLLGQIPDYLQAYVEIPIGGDPAPLVAAIAGGGGRPKVRTGGVTADAFPKPKDLVRFIRACLSAGVPFKATAGLHHPLRAEYRLTYEPGSPSGTMFGFLNVYLAAAFMADGLEDADAELLLEERDPKAIRFDESGIEWRGRRITLEALEAPGDRGIVSFGSCSFTEPVEDLQSIGLL